jgi:hypothetical protein
MSDNNSRVEDQDRTEINRIISFIETELRKLEGGTTGGLLTSADQPNANSKRAIEDIIHSELKNELMQVTQKARDS